MLDFGVRVVRATARVRQLYCCIDAVTALTTAYRKDFMANENMCARARCLKTVFLLAICLPFATGCDNSAPSQPALVGSNDAYAIAAGMTLHRAAPGVLANDESAVKEVTVSLVAPVRNGAISLAADGSFTYEPTFKFSGRDSFSYQISDGESVSDPIQVTIGFPNVIAILVDDLGLGDLSVYNSQAVATTPNLAAMAEAGIVFSQAHAAAANCSPSRYSILTGNYPYRGRLSSGIWSTYEASTMLIPGQQTLGDTFKEAGYKTGLVGKLHNGSAFWNQAGTGYTRNHREIDFTRKFDRGPTQFGFDYSFLLPGGVSSLMYAYFENDQLVKYNAASGDYETFADNKAAHDSFVYIKNGWGNTFNGGAIGASGWATNNYDSRKAGSILTRKALEFLSQAMDEDAASPAPNPFFLFFAPPELHVPYAPPAYFDAAHGDDEVAAPAGLAVAGTGPNARSEMIREIDLLVGEITALLEQRGQLDNTLIVFTSDNGPTWDSDDDRVNPQGSVDGVPLRGRKGQIYEGGHIVPLIARWGDGSREHSAIRPASRSSQLLGLQDLAATFYALLGRQRPLLQANDSKSLLPVLLGQQAEEISVRDHLIVQGSPRSAANKKNFVDRAFYQRDAAGDLWKLSVVSSNTDPLAKIDWKELYNLSVDPGETTDLLENQGSQLLLQQMQAKYLELIAQPQTIASFL